MKASILPVITALSFTVGAMRAEPIGTAFTYQGRLTQSACGQPTLNGFYDLRVRLYDALTGGTLLGPELTCTVPVATGNSASSYTLIPTSGHVLSSEQGLLCLSLTLEFANDTDYVRIAGVRLRLKHE